MPVCARQQCRHYYAATGTAPHIATLVNPICAMRIHRLARRPGVFLVVALERYQYYR